LTDKYVTRKGQHFQYIVDDGKPFYRALVDYQEYDSDTDPYTETHNTGDSGDSGTLKTIFPGSDVTGYPPVY